VRGDHCDESPAGTCLSLAEAQRFALVKFHLAVTVMLCSLAVRAAEFDHHFVRLNHVLSAHLKDGRVDYAALKKDSRELNAALDEMAAVQRSDFSRWTERQQVSFLINLYNASTLRLIVSHYPLKSIKDIGNILRGPFKQPAVRLFSETTTLEYIEHELLRKNYREPRIHFALVCAAKGCPSLRNEPYVASKLNEQLEDQGRTFLSATEKNRFDAHRRVLYLSPIFKWFHEDFEKPSGSVLKFVTPFFPPQLRAQLESAGPVAIRYTDYDWSLNEKTAR
jgi:hypothetical protein